MQTTQKIIPCLWYDDNAEEAVELYTSLFKNSHVSHTQRYGKEGFEIHKRPEGSVMSIDFELGGYSLVAMNGGPIFQFTPAISLYATLETRQEIDTVWNGLLDTGGTVMMPLDTYPWSERYGWIRDKFGLTWQISLGSLHDVGGQTLTPSFLFTGQQHGKAEAAIHEFTTLFPDARIHGIAHYPDTPENNANGSANTVMHGQFYLFNETFMAMDSAYDHGFTFNEAFSLQVFCDTQAEIDRYWQALSHVPEAEQCGWLKDRYGISWQIVPRQLVNLLADPNPNKSEAVMRAFMPMKKLDIATIQTAYDQA